MTTVTMRAMALFGALAIAACSGSTIGRTVIPPDAPGGRAAPLELSPFSSANGFYPMAGPNAVVRACPLPARIGEMECFALERIDMRQGASPGALPLGFGPLDLQSAYHAPSKTKGKGQTVAIVDAFGYKTAASDLAKYRSTFALPACTTASGCLKIVNETGGSKLPPVDPGWDLEQALDLDMVSAMCPNCKILLVQASSASTIDLYTGVKTAATMGANAVSNSYGGAETEATDTTSFPPGHTYVASSGDAGGGLKNGGGPQQPCSLSNVVCVGGTALTKTGTARGWTEVVWNTNASTACGKPCGAANSGCSKIVAKPSWQHDTGCKKRSESDISADASVMTPVAVYVTPGGGWSTFGGTSASAPMIAAMVALNGNGKTANVPSTIWSHGGGTSLYDVVSGTNIYKPVTGPCASSVVYICKAGKGYDGPTGWGSPNGIKAL